MSFATDGAVGPSYAVGSWGLAALFAGVAVLVYFVARSRLSRAHAAEQAAVERRDRFFVVAAGELDAPLATLRGHLVSLDPAAATPARLATLTQEVDRLRE